ncbi:protein Sst2p [[Candida] anglica]|uniref:Protein Sst2p n=1 Tax=[Candida] anglica TaxID=148631 RepID=A0ABP0ECG0_9ASCO
MPNTREKSPASHERVLKDSRLNVSVDDVELADIYSLMIIHLNLTETVKNSKFSFGFSTNYPYTFHVAQALEVMKDMKIAVEFGSTSTSISYSIQNEEYGRKLINRFYVGNLLHSPADRTRSEPKDGVLLQPTPKGVAILNSFCDRIGIDKSKYPDIIFSNFNSMHLIKLVRESGGHGKILYSKYFIYLLFICMMGNSPHIWSPNDKPPTFQLKITRNDSINTTATTEESIQSYASRLKRENSHLQGGVPFKTQQSQTESKLYNYPLYHRYFTNPESDSHIHYFTCSKGVRVFKSREFRHADKTINVSYCFSGKAIKQWLCDCTDVLNPRYATSFADLMLRMRLIEPIIYSKANFETFSSDRDAFYQMSALGIQVCHWEKQVQSDSEDLTANSNSSVETLVPRRDCSSIGLAVIMRDPGLRYLFKEHLESEFCTENYQVYCLLKEFASKVKSYNKLLTIHETSPNLKSQLKSMGESCLSLAFHIYVIFLAPDSPSLLNINFEMRNRVTELLVTNEPSLQSNPKKHLNEIEEVFDSIGAHIYRLMEVDTLPKFLNGKIFQDAMLTIDIRQFDNDELN